MKKNTAKKKGEKGEPTRDILPASRTIEVPTGNRKRTTEDIKQDTAKAFKLYLKGHTYSSIQAHLNQDKPEGKQICTAQVYRDIKRYIEEYKSLMFSDLNEATTLELARINAVEAEGWRAWEQSREDIIRYKERILKQTNAAGKANGQSKENTREVMKSAGNEKYLDLVKWAIEMRCKIFGIKAPEKSIQTQVHLHIKSE